MAEFEASQRRMRDRFSWGGEMLTLKPNCEHCDADLPADSTDARICSFECTFCEDCVENVLRNVCPNCGGDLVQRPIRPQAKLAARPAATERHHKPIEMQMFAPLRARLEDVPPHQR
jgi:uncharacterized protein